MLKLKKLSSYYFFCGGKTPDWQYVSKIHESLREGNIMKSMDYIRQSQDNQVVLDRQTFHNVYERMEQLKSPLNLKQQLYLCFRKNFSPHALVLKWLNNLSSSEDLTILKLIQNDYKKLNMQFPLQAMQKIKKLEYANQSKTQNQPSKQKTKLDEKEKEAKVEPTNSKSKQKKLVINSQQIKLKYLSRILNQFPCSVSFQDIEFHDEDAIGSKKFQMNLGVLYSLLKCQFFEVQGKNTEQFLEFLQSLLQNKVKIKKIQLQFNSSTKNRNINQEN